MESKTHRGLPLVSARSARVWMTRPAPFSTNHPRRYYFALVVKSQIVYLAMADKSICDIEAAHRFLKDISTKCAPFCIVTLASSTHFPSTRASLPLASWCVRSQPGNSVQYSR